ncbi:hypothetical protein [Desulforegula conservatrix]|uniref:hypothetical protein n=1 Tax=Desulforegula conservatrix TaxID=153026 RepID=UPI000426755F|nr:hypothetical protein [Desulforegula conservatrix]
MISSWDGTKWMSGAAKKESISGLDAFTYAPGGKIFGVLVRYCFEEDTSRRNNIRKWNGKGWEDIKSKADGFVNVLAIHPDGSLYAGGEFGKIEGVESVYIAKWDGTKWIKVGTGKDLSI